MIRSKSLYAFSRPYSYFRRSYRQSNFGKNMKARLVRIEYIFSYKGNQSYNFATVKPKALKLCKIIYLAALVYVISLISLRKWPNKKLHDGHICIRCIAFSENNFRLISKDKLQCNVQYLHYYYHISHCSKLFRFANKESLKRELTK